MIELRGRALRERVGRTAQVASATAVRLEDGTASGVRAVIVRAAGLELTIVLDRAMDVAACTFRGIPLVWHGPGGIAPAHPGTLNDDAFERRFFGGLLTTCGLEAFGPAGSDEYGTWGQHGHIDQSAAESVACDVNDERGTVVVEGIVHQARMFGERLVLRRRWELGFARSELRLRDEVYNAGGERVPHMMLYHCNAGYPLLDRATRVAIQQRSMRPRDERAQQGIEDWNRGGPPEPGFREQVFVHVPQAGEDGWSSATIHNPELAGGTGFTVWFKPEQLPACFSWRMLGIGTYVMAVEPANCPVVQGRIAAERCGVLPFIEPGETRTYELRFEFFTRRDVAGE